MTKNTEISIPLIPQELLMKLNELFPEQSAELQWNEKEIYYRAGQRNVIRFLNQHFQIQSNNVMEKK